VISAEARILVATDTLADGELVSDLLRHEFDSVFISTAERRIAADFDQHKPDVLVLAFKELERAERYYLGLYRQSAIVHTLSHRTLVLCSMDDVGRAFELCRKGYFDDYVLFWPMVYDAHRLSMSVLLARRALAGGRMAVPKELEAAHARTAGERDLPHSPNLAAAPDPLEIDAAAPRPAEATPGDVIENFDDLLRGPRQDRTVEGPDPQSAPTQPQARGGARPTVPVQASPVGRKGASAPQPESPKPLKAVVRHLLPLVLVVDDDEFQCKLLARLLASDRYELAFAHSAAEALGAVRKRRPDLILMDVLLPDLDGVEITRRLKSQSEYATVPIVMITGQSAREVVAASLQAGAVDFVVKPFEREILLRKVEKYLGV